MSVALIRSATIALALLVVGVQNFAPPAEAQTRVGLIFAIDDVVDPVLLPASEVEYVVEVLNPTTTPVTGVVVTADTPANTFFGEAATSIGSIAAPVQGDSGTMTVTVGTLEPGASARIRFELGLDAQAGSEIDFTASMTSDAGAPLTASEPTFVESPGAAILRWDALAAAPSELRLPRMTRVERPEAPLFHQNDFPIGVVLPDVEYRVYRSDVRDVEATEANLVATFPSTQLNTGALTRPGFYAVTAVIGGVETDATNATSFGIGEPIVDTVAVIGRAVKARGSNFDPNVDVTVDGLEFTKPASVLRNGTRVTQGGKLENGLGLKKYFQQHFVSLVEFRNANGAVTSVRYEHLVLGN